jgi:hypothetical protein
MSSWWLGAMMGGLVGSAFGFVACTTWIRWYDAHLARRNGQ